MAAKRIEVALEVGQRKTFASAVDWPGWSRAGKESESALKSLYEYGQRYAGVLAGSSFGFAPPSSIDEFFIVERGEGNSTTDYGAPDLILESDFEPVGSGQHEFFQGVLQACWQAFDAAAELAEDKTLRKGPRGGGRNLEAMIAHVIEADESYLYRLGWNHENFEELPPEERMLQLRQEILAGLAAKIAGELPEQGPRGGKRWPARFFVRRVAWHELDHAWEIEDRISE